LEISVAAHARGSQEILDYEYWHGMVGWDYQRTLRASFNVNSMIAFLAIKAEPVLFKDTDEALKVNRADGGH
jgi:hypothetical protein